MSSVISVHIDTGTWGMYPTASWPELINWIVVYQQQLSTSSISKATIRVSTIDISIPNYDILYSWRSLNSTGWCQNVFMLLITTMPWVTYWSMIRLGLVSVRLWPTHPSSQLVESVERHWQIHPNRFTDDQLFIVMCLMSYLSLMALVWVYITEWSDLTTSTIVNLSDMIE